MMQDIQNQLSAAQAFTGAATVSTNSYQKQSAKQDISIGILMAILVLPTVAAGAGSTHTFDVIQADDAALTTNVEVLGSVTKLAAALTVGQQVIIPIPQGSMSRTYIGMRNTSTGGTTTVTCDAYLMALADIPKYKSFPKVVDATV